MRADARGMSVLLVGVELGLDACLEGDRVGQLVGVLERLAHVGLCLVGAALALEDGDLGLADPFRDGGRTVGSRGGTCPASSTGPGRPSAYVAPVMSMPAVPPTVRGKSFGVVRIADQTRDPSKVILMGFPRSNASATRSSRPTLAILRSSSTGVAGLAAVRSGGTGLSGVSMGTSAPSSVSVYDPSSRGRRLSPPKEPADSQAHNDGEEKAHYLAHVDQRSIPRPRPGV